MNCINYSLLKNEVCEQGRIKLFVGLGLFDNQGHIFHSIL